MQRKRQEEGICFEEFAGKVGRGYPDRSIGLRETADPGVSVCNWADFHYQGCKHIGFSVVSSAYNFITTSFFPSSLADWGDLFVDKILVGVLDPVFSKREKLRTWIFTI